MVEHLAESYARIRNHSSWVDSGIEQLLRHLAKPLPNLGDDVAIIRVILHILRQPLHMHQTDRAAVFDDYLEHLRITQSRDIVDQISTRIERRPRDACSSSIDRDSDIRKRVAHRLDDSQDARRLFGRANRFSPRPSRFTSDIEPISAILHHTNRKSQSLVDRIQSRISMK